MRRTTGNPVALTWSPASPAELKRSAPLGPQLPRSFDQGCLADSGSPFDQQHAPVAVERAPQGGIYAFQLGLALEQTFTAIRSAPHRWHEGQDTRGRPVPPHGAALIWGRFRGPSPVRTVRPRRSIVAWPYPPDEIRVRVDPGSEPVAGSISEGDGLAAPFVGYVQLIAELERIREASCPMPAPDLYLNRRHQLGGI